MSETTFTVIYILGILTFLGSVLWVIPGEFAPPPEYIRSRRQMRQIHFLLKAGWEIRWVYDHFDNNIEAQSPDEDVWRKLSTACERQVELDKIRRLNLPKSPEPPKPSTEINYHGSSASGKYVPESWKN